MISEDNEQSSQTISTSRGTSLLAHAAQKRLPIWLGFGKPPTLGKHQAARNISQVELSISCGDLVQPDSRIALYISNGKDDGEVWTEVGLSEIIRANNCPQFAKTFGMDFKFNEVQDLKVVVYNMVNKNTSVVWLEKDNQLGAATCTLSEILRSPGQVLTLPLERGEAATEGAAGERCYASVWMMERRPEQDGVAGMRITMECQVSLSRGSALFSDVFLVVSWAPLALSPRSRPHSRRDTLLYRSECCQGRDVAFQPFGLALEDLVGHGGGGGGTRAHRQVVLELWGWSARGAHERIGSATTTASALLDDMPKRGHEFAIASDASKSYGVLNVKNCHMEAEPSFLQYLKSGLDVCPMLAVDFSNANRSSSKGESLHNSNSKKPNLYEQSMFSFMRVLEPYCKSVPLYGMGAKIPPQMLHSNCFPMTLDPERVDVAGGMAQILEIYRRCTEKVKLSTMPILDEVVDTAADYVEHQLASADKYFVLILLVQRVEHLNELIQSLADLADLPLSVIVMSLGDDQIALNKFKYLAEELEVICNGRQLVQYVTLQGQRRAKESKRRTLERIASGALSRIPQQMVQFCTMHNVPVPEPREPRYFVTRKGTTLPMVHPCEREYVKSEEDVAFEKMYSQQAAAHILEERSTRQETGTVSMRELRVQGQGNRLGSATGERPGRRRTRDLQVDGEQALNMLNLPDAMGSRSQDLPLRVSAASFRDATKKPRFFARLFGSCCGSSSKIADSGGKEGQAQSRKHLARSQAGQSLRDMSLASQARIKSVDGDDSSTRSRRELSGTPNGVVGGAAVSSRLAAVRQQRRQSNLGLANMLDNAHTSTEVKKLRQRLASEGSVRNSLAQKTQSQPNPSIAASMMSSFIHGDVGPAQVVQPSSTMVTPRLIDLQELTTEEATSPDKEKHARDEGKEMRKDKEENKRQKKEKGRQKSFQRSNSAKHAAASGSPSKHSGGGDVHMGQEGVVSANTNSSGDGRAQREGFDFCNVSNPPEGARTQIFTENEHLNVNGDHLAIDQQRNIALKTEAGLLRQKSSSFSRIDGAARVMSNDGSTRSKEGRANYITVREGALMKLKSGKELEITDAELHGMMKHLKSLSSKRLSRLGGL